LALVAQNIDVRHIQQTRVLRSMPLAEKVMCGTSGRKPAHRHQYIGHETLTKKLGTNFGKYT
jgi:hypothetical protein